MRRLVAIFLLVLLPLQFSWAVAASYCQHEAPSAGTQHFGHHQHDHDGHAAPDASADTKLPGSIDNDCNACHAGCVVALFTAATPAVFAATTTIADHLPEPPASAPSARPERPNWFALA